MIDFRIDGTKVKIFIEVGVFDKMVVFTHECSHDYFAHLMRDSYINHMNRKLEKIRREAYNQGWKDAKSKKVAKNTFFSNWW